MNDILLNGIIGIVSSVIAWFLAKRKYNAEVGDTVIKNMENALEFYKKLSDDNKNRLDVNQKKLDEVMFENNKLQSEINILKTQIHFLMKYNCMRMGCKRRMTNSPEQDKDIDRDNV